MTWTAEALLEDTAWMRALAGRLVGDGATADDLVQDAWTLALDRDEAPSRAWLAGVLRKLSFTRARSEARRSAREAVAARPEGEPDAGEALARVEAQRLLVGALLALDEPYRSALVWRYSEGLDPGAIAARCGAPLGTVHSRLKRGLDKLKAELARSAGGAGGSWIAAVAPLLGVRRAAPQLAAAAGAGWGTKAAVVAAAAAMLWSAPQLLRERALVPEPSAALDREAGVDLVGAQPAPVIGDGQEPSIERTAALPDAPTAEASSAGWALALTVLHPDQRPAAGAEVLLGVTDRLGLRTHALGATDAHGRLERPLEDLDALGLALQVACDAFLLVSHPQYPPRRAFVIVHEGPTTIERTLVLEDGPRVAGRVLGPDGRPLAGVRCRMLKLAEGTRRKQVSYAVSGTDGRFALEPRAGARGYVSVEHELGTATTPVFDLGVANQLGDLRIEALETLRGRVVYPDGSPARCIDVETRLVERATRDDGSALPGHAWAQMPSDEDGYFAFRGLRRARYCVRAPMDAHADVCTMEVDLPGPAVTLIARRPRLLVRVRDTEGKEAHGIEVHLTALEGPWEETPGLQWLTTWGSPATAAAEVVAGGTYSVFVPGRGRMLCEEVVRIPEDGFEHEVELVFGAERPACSLRVVVEKPGGGACEDLSVHVLSFPSLAYLDDFEDLRPGPDGLLEGLPEGDLRIAVALDQQRATAEFLVLPQRHMDVRLTPRATEMARFQAVSGGRIDVRLDVTGWPPDAPDAPDPDGAEWDAWLTAYGVQVLLGPRRGDEPRSERSLLKPGEGERRVGLVSGWVPGAAASAFGVREPGVYPYRVTGPAWLEVEGELELRGGETTQLEVVLVPR